MELTVSFMFSQLLCYPLDKQQSATSAQLQLLPAPLQSPDASRKEPGEDKVLAYVRFPEGVISPDTCSLETKRNSKSP